MKIAILGHTGTVGSAIVRQLESGEDELIGASSSEVNLCDQKSTMDWFNHYRPDAVYVAAGRVGGIGENIKYPVEFLIDNTLIAINSITAANNIGVKKLLYVGSSCMYPVECMQPMHESMLMSGPLEPTNEGYALAKMVGVRLCKYFRSEYGANFISVLPCNIYGPGDNFDPETSHVMAALIGKFVQAKKHNLEEIILWGTGNVRREFLHVDDCAKGCIFAMNKYEGEEPLNIGYGMDIAISELAQSMKKFVDWNGKLVYNKNKP